MNGLTPDQYVDRIAAAFGCVHGKPCSDRIGYVYLTWDGIRSTVAFTDPVKKIPKLFGCEHEALDAAVEFLCKAAMILEVAHLTGATKRTLPPPEAFEYVYADAVLEAEISDLSGAHTILAQVMK
jgi:hypothetical protein